MTFLSALRRPLAGQRASGERKFGFAVVGLGHGAEKMCSALRHSPSAQVTAAVSSSVVKATAFARRFGIPNTYSYEQMAELAADASVDAVYLALPVAPHRRFTELAVAAGKHVLCEKPMASSIADAQAMIAAAAAARRQLMVAYRLDYDPMHHLAARLLAEGALGDVRRVTSGFGIVAKPGWRFDPELAGGGSLFDVGVYPIHALHSLFGEQTITSATILEHPETGMELDAVWSGTLPGGAVFECSSSYVRRIPDALHIQCDRGTLTLEHAYAYDRTRLRAQFRDEAGRMQTIAQNDSRWNPSLFRLEAEHLAESVRSGNPNRSSGESGLRDLELVARIEQVASRAPAIV